MPSYTFDEVALTGNKTVECSGGCGRKLKRQKKFSQTLNPFNKNADGLPKSTAEIHAELRKDIVKWKKLPVTCKHCAV